MRAHAVTLVVLAIYVAGFHLWRMVSLPARVASALALAILMAVVIRHAKRRGYFRSRWDEWFHWAVVGDFAIEGLFNPWHEDLGFWLCALAFAVVLLGYRARKNGTWAPPGPRSFLAPGQS